MKKLFACICAACILFAATGCMSNSNTVTYNPANPYWLKSENFGNTVDPSFSETCLYGITYKKAETANENISVEYTDGSYSSTLSAEKYPDENGEYYYVYKTELHVTGKYTFKSGETYDFNDTAVSKTYFTWDSGFNFAYSELAAESSLPTTASGIQDKFGNRFIKTAYVAKTKYVSGKAETTFEITEGDPEYFALQNGFAGTFKKYNSGNFIDSNMMEFAVRSFNFDDGMTYSFSTIDVLNNAKHSMNFALSGTETLSIKNLLLNGSYSLGDKVDDENGAHGENGNKYDYVLTSTMAKVTLKLNETYNGSPITCKYFKDTVSLHHYLYEKETPLPYNLGSLIYTLKEIQTSSN